MLFTMGAVCSTGRFAVVLIVLVSVLCMTLPGAATDVFRLHIPWADGNGWQVRDVELELIWRSPQTVDLRLSAAYLQLPPPLDRVTGVALECQQADLNADAVTCHGGVLQLHTPLLDQAPMQVTFRYQRTSRELHFTLINAALAGGRLNIEAQFDQAHWWLTFRANTLNITQLSNQWADLAAGILPWLHGIKSSGQLHMN